MSLMFIIIQSSAFGLFHIKLEVIGAKAHL